MDELKSELELRKSSSHKNRSKRSSGESQERTAKCGGKEQSRFGNIEIKLAK